ncbi:MAG: Glutamine--tRNA ligase [Synergistetes bacterium ADurb.BinA166]|nr:MAG: Glutamine--tRNA ligase [Synergistetes bacterium ADurb.BinA166]
MNWKDEINKASLEVVTDAVVERHLADAPPGTGWQFERLGYFFKDPIDSTPDRPVFNRTVTIRDSWARTAKTGGGE